MAGRATPKSDPFEESTSGASTEPDPFEEADAAPRIKFPSMEQLATGAPKVPATYARGLENEYTGVTTGRLVLMEPVAVTFNMPSNIQGSGKKFVDRWSVRVIVLDGEPITHALDKDGDEVYEFPEPLVAPFVLESMYVSQDILGKQLKKKWDMETEMARTMLLGRVMKLPATQRGFSKPYAISSLEPGYADIAKAYLKAHPKKDAFDA